MPRTPRNALPDGYFHIMLRATDGRRLFHTDVDRKLFLGLLQIVVERQGWKVVTIALMDTHAHILASATTSQLSRGLWWLNWRYAEHYKATRGPHFGHVFGNRPKTKPVRDERYLLAVLRYIARNPVGVFCERAEDYRWSGHRALLGESAPLPLLARDEALQWFGPIDPVARYRAFVDGREPEDHTTIDRWATRPPDDRPELDVLIADGSPASLLLAYDRWRYSIRDIAKVVGRSSSTIHAGIIRARSEAEPSQ